MKHQLQHFRGNETFVKRIYDLIDRSERYQRVLITPFFTPEEAMITKTICGKQILYETDGGYEGAERVRFALKPYEDDEVHFPTVCLKATYSSSFSNIKHPDVLGAIMNLGIEREKIGDFIIEEDRIYLFCDELVENYLCCNLTKIKRCSLHFQRTQEKVQSSQQQVLETKIVSSLRLDVIVASLAHVSRGKAVNDIKAGYVKINHTVHDQVSTQIKEQDMISIRKTGRFQFIKVENRTKKDHYVVSFLKYV